MKVSELNLRPEILKALKKMKYEELTPIQEQTLKPIMAGRDLIAMAETGSGKTAACAIPMVQRVNPELREVQGLVIVPTRELALQYVDEIARIAQFSPVEAFGVYGGFSMDIQKGKLAHGVHILVATPGRLIDLLYNTPLSLSHVTTFVLDEADEMLDMGFLSDMEFIFSCLVHEHQTLLFSATMPKEIKTLAQRYLRDPEIIELNVEQVAPENLVHMFEMVRPPHRFENLMAFLETQKPKQAILFCNSRHSSEALYKRLKERVKSVEVIHGGLDQNKRTSLFRRFKKLDIRYMIATDVAGRGLDFSHASHVINYDFPLNPEIYTHRTGRTARMGREGVALTLVAPADQRRLKSLLRVNRVEPRWIGQAPDLAQVSGRKKPAGAPAQPKPAGAKRRRRGGRKRNGRGKGGPKPAADAPAGGE